MRRLVVGTAALTLVAVAGCGSEHAAEAPASPGPGSTATVVAPDHALRSRVEQALAVGSSGTATVADAYPFVTDRCRQFLSQLGDVLGGVDGRSQPKQGTITDVTVTGVTAVVYVRYSDGDDEREDWQLVDGTWRMDCGDFSSATPKPTATSSAAVVRPHDGISCTNLLPYSRDPRSNAEINSIGESTGICPEPLG